MKNKLTPVTGALVVGLVGLANANCWYESSGVCASANVTVVGSINDGTCMDYIYPTVDWEYYPATPISNNGWQGTKSVWCEGPAYYVNCHDGNHYSIGTFQWKTYQGVDRTSGGS